MKQTRVPFLLILWILAQGCSNKPVEDNDYLLRQSTPAPASNSVPVIALDNVKVAPYLDQAGIVIESAEGRVKVARDHRWAEPLSEAVRRYLQVALTKTLGEPVAADLVDRQHLETWIDVIVYQLHGSMDGNVTLVAEWQVRDADGGTVQAQHSYATTALLDKDGYEGVVTAHQRVLDELAAQIAASLQRLQHKRLF